MTLPVVTLGETMGLFTATDAGARDFRLGIGGAESNVAIGVVRLGGTATWMGRVGSDAAGDLVRRELRAEGVDARTVLDPGAPTGLMVKRRGAGGGTRVDYHRRGSAGSRLSPDDLDLDVIRAAGILHVTGITPALSASAAATVDAAIETARDAGVPVSFDVNHRERLWPGAEAAPVYRRLTARADVLLAGEDEARLLVEGDSPVELVRALAALGPATVLLKRGAAGCLALVDGDLLEVAAVPVEVVDTVGAGDAYAAGYLAELLAGVTPAERLRTAVRAGAFACLGPGDWESLPRRDELDALDPGADPVRR